jgi:raffinose/stachyose/melibiose transport system permease protein
MREIVTGGGGGGSTKRRSGSAIGIYAALSVLAFIAIAPLVVLLFNSLKTKAELGRNPLGFPSSPQFGAFREAWTRGDYATSIKNSAVISSATAIGVCVIAGLAAYALSRLDLPGGSIIVAYLFAGITIPAQLYIIPLFSLWVKLDLMDTRIGLIIIYWAIFSPFSILLLRSFMLALPRELEDASRVDGANEWQTLFRIVLPLALPGVLVVALVSALMSWNEFFFAITFIQSDSLKPVTISFLAFSGRFGRNWGLTSAAGIIVIMPMLALFLVLQRRFIAGLTAGALKG